VAPAHSEQAARHAALYGAQCRSIDLPSSGLACVSTTTFQDATIPGSPSLKPPRSAVPPGSRPPSYAAPARHAPGRSEPGAQAAVRLLWFFGETSLRRPRISMPCRARSVHPESHCLACRYQRSPFPEMQCANCPVAGKWARGGRPAAYTLHPFGSRWEAACLSGSSQVATEVDTTSDLRHFDGRFLAEDGRRQVAGRCPTAKNTYRDL
jgi:hypothetical protein